LNTGPPREGTTAVERNYTDLLDDLWNTVLGGPSAGQALEAMSEEERTRFRELLQARLQASGAQCQAFDASA
jgi:hypothetical protein